MAVFLSMADIPDSVCVQFLKAGILAPDETFRIVPLKRWWRFFYDAPNPGFVVTDKKVILYGSGFGGLTKDREFLLQDLVRHEFAATDEGPLFRFVLKDGSEYSLTIALSEQDGRMIEVELGRLLAKVRSSGG
ncbi:MAG: hypothetical protein P4N41_06750 [Negativicutes bacterium]|nr:hypothetical protein [Negativicutes bacterium]